MQFGFIEKLNIKNHTSQPHNNNNNNNDNRLVPLVRILAMEDVSGTCKSNALKIINSVLDSVTELEVYTYLFNGLHYNLIHIQFQPFLYVCQLTPPSRNDSVFVLSLGLNPLLILFLLLFLMIPHLALMKEIILRLKKCRFISIEIAFFVFLSFFIISFLFLSTHPLLQDYQDMFDKFPKEFVNNIMLENGGGVGEGGVGGEGIEVVVWGREGEEGGRGVWIEVVEGEDWVYYRFLFIYLFIYLFIFFLFLLFLSFS